MFVTNGATLTVVDSIFNASVATGGGVATASPGVDAAGTSARS